MYAMHNYAKAHIQYTIIFRNSCSENCLKALSRSYNQLRVVVHRSQSVNNVSNYQYFFSSLKDKGIVILSQQLMQWCFFRATRRQTDRRTGGQAERRTDEQTDRQVCLRILCTIAWVNKYHCVKTNFPPLPTGYTNEIVHLVSHIIST